MLEELLRFKWIIKNIIGIALLVIGLILALNYELGLWIILTITPGIFVLLGFNNPTVRDCKNIR